MFKELLIPVALVALVASMIVPVPPAAMDFLLLGNLLFALVILLSAVHATDPIKLSALPTLLLLATLMRLALNVSTTRLILGTGEAGKAIEAFGSIVIGGNLIVGAVIFLMITLIQFMVIAKGSERVAEVSARFTLDALPGKQMSIDADVRAGLIDFDSARKKRQNLQLESRFYGALDGAMKFIKGDAIAGLIIIAINIIGGIVSGLLVDGLDIYAALTKYTILSVGDGLLSQIPALLNSLAAGIIVTRIPSSESSSLANDLITQLGADSRAKFVIAGVSLALACIPGMPTIPLVGLAMLMALIAISALRAPKSALQESNVKFEPRTPAVLKIELAECVRVVLTADMLKATIENFRQDMFSTIGLALAFPEVSFSSDLSTGFKITMRGVPVVRVEIEQQSSEKVTTELGSALRKLVQTRVVEFIDDVMTRRLVDYFDREAPELVAAVIPTMISVTQLTALLKRLVGENISICNFDIIMQAVAETGSKATNERHLLEETRLALRRVLSAQFAPGGILTALTIDPIIDLEVSRAERSSTAPSIELLNVVFRYFENNNLGREDPCVIVTSKAARALLRDYLVARRLRAIVLAYEEMTDDVRIEAYAHIQISDEQALSDAGKLCQEQSLT